MREKEGERERERLRDLTRLFELKRQGRIHQLFLLNAIIDQDNLLLVEILKNQLAIQITMRWYRLVGSLNSPVSFAKKPYKNRALFQKRPYKIMEPTHCCHPIHELTIEPTFENFYLERSHGAFFSLQKFSKVKFL